MQNVYIRIKKSIEFLQFASFFFCHVVPLVFKGFLNKYMKFISNCLQLRKEEKKTYLNKARVVLLQQQNKKRIIFSKYFNNQTSY